MAVDMSTPDVDDVAMLGEIVGRYADPDPALVGKLPRITCRDCTPKRTCQRHTKERCQTCGSWITSGHIHLDYVGHAEITMILLEIDPLWTWEPAAWGDDGGPMIRRNNDDPDNPMLELWGTLTVLGHSRPAVGTCPPKPEAAKELVGDLLRNGAMRFGIATGLWARTDAEARRHAIDAEPSPQSDGGQPAQQQRQAPPQGEDEPPPGDPDDAPPPPQQPALQAQQDKPSPASQKQINMLGAVLRDVGKRAGLEGVVDANALSVAVFGKMPMYNNEPQITSKQANALITMVKGNDNETYGPVVDADPQRAVALCVLAVAAQAELGKDGSNRDVPAWIRSKAGLAEKTPLTTCGFESLLAASEEVDVESLEAF